MAAMMSSFSSIWSEILSRCQVWNQIKRDEIYIAKYIVTASPSCSSYHRRAFDQTFRKFWLKIEWNRTFPEIRFENLGPPLEVVLFSGNSGNFLFQLAFLPGMNRPQYLKSWKARIWRRTFRVDTALLDAKWSATVRTYSWSPILHRNVKIWFSGILWTGRSEFPVGKFAYSREKSSQVALITRRWCLSRSGKYQGGICRNWLWMCVI